MRLNDEFKQSTDRDFKEGDYIGRKIFNRVVIVIVSLVIIFGAIGFGYKKIAVDANREIFKHSIAYTETAAQFLAKEYQEYNKADNDTDRNTIMQYVANRYPNLNSDEIENRDLRNFYNQCIGGNKNEK